MRFAVDFTSSSSFLTLSASSSLHPSLAPSHTHSSSPEHATLAQLRSLSNLVLCTHISDTAAALTGRAPLWQDAFGNMRIFLGLNLGVVGAMPTAREGVSRGLDLSGPTRATLEQVLFTRLRAPGRRQQVSLIACGIQ